MARFNLLNYAYDHYPSTEDTLYVTLEWRCEVINKGEMQEVFEYEKAGTWLCDHIRKNGIHALTPQQSFEVCHVLSRLKVLSQNPRLRKPSQELVATLNRFALMIGWRVWRESTFGDEIAAICREVEHDRRVSGWMPI